MPISYAIAMNITSLWILSSHVSYFGLKDPINMPILRLSIALMKICHIPHVIFQTASQFFFFTYFFYLIPQVMLSVFSVLPCAHFTCMGHFLI